MQNDQQRQHQQDKNYYRSGFFGMVAITACAQTLYGGKGTGAALIGLGLVGLGIQYMAGSRAQVNFLTGGLKVVLLVGILVTEGSLPLK